LGFDADDCEAGVDLPCAEAEESLSSPDRGDALAQYRSELQSFAFGWAASEV
jgi:hypothetical protein